MPLIALDTAHGALIDLTAVDASTWAGIWRQRTGDRLVCRGCGQPLIAKRMAASELRFFAHQVTIPACPHNGESSRHLGLKVVWADAFRAAGWAAELEVAGADWRADVLVTGPDQRVAVEVQLASLAVVDAEDRAARHAASGVRTLWVVQDVRPQWAQATATVIVDTDDQVVRSVLVATAHQDVAIAGAGPVALFARRFAEGRLTPVDDPDGLIAFYGEDPSRAFFQVDQCATSVIDAARERRAKRDADLEDRHRQAAAAAAARGPGDRLMAASLKTLQEWMAQYTQWNCWFGPGRDRDADTAVLRDWDRSTGVMVYIGWQKPNYVFGVAEPRGATPRKDPRVVAWVSGLDPAADTTGFETVYGPDTPLDLSVMDLLKARSRRRW
jgi:hypothetical protein